MGSGAGKGKKGEDGEEVPEVQVVQVAAASGDRTPTLIDPAAGLLAAKRLKEQAAQRAEGGSPAPVPSGTPEKPKSSPDVKRPQLKKSRSTRDQEGTNSISLEQQQLAAKPPVPEAPSEQLPETLTDTRSQQTPPALEPLVVTKEEVPELSETPAFHAGPANLELQEEVPQAWRPTEFVVPPPQESPKPVDLATACRNCNVEAVKSFCVSKARSARGLSDCEEALFDAYGDSVLHHAIQGGSEEVVRLLLEIGRVEVDIPNARNETALELACRRGNTGMVGKLLDAGADPDRCDNNGLTPFLTAVFAGIDHSMLDVLLRAGANLSAQDSRGIAALHFGALRGDLPLVEWLLTNKADSDVQTEHCTTPLMLAAKRGLTEIVSLLLNHRASTSHADEAGCTALMHALSTANTEAAKLILKSGASVDAIDCAGRSPLFHAVLGGCAECVKGVLDCGGRVNILDEEGRSPLYQACLMSADALVALLLNTHSADPNLAGHGTVIKPAATAGEEDEQDRESSAARACLEEARTCLQVCATLAHNELMGRLIDVVQM